MQPEGVESQKMVAEEICEFLFSRKMKWWNKKKFASILGQYFLVKVAYGPFYFQKKKQRYQYFVYIEKDEI